MFIKNLNNLPFRKASGVIVDFCKKRIKLSTKDIELILKLEDKEIINLFLYDYQLFDQKDFIFLEKFINKNLDNENKDFVSDLIYVALDFGLDLNFTKILSFLKTEKEDTDLVVLASLEYIHKNVKIIYIKELIENLESIRNQKNYYQNEQLLASLILYRITYKTHYLTFIKELILSDNSNLKYFESILKTEMYNEKYFNLTEINKMFGET
ncbi:hypothetical protein ACTS9D_00395 [Empedobacter brevis]